MKRLPVSIGGEIFLRPVNNPAAKAKSTIIGARHGDFLIIEDPVVRFNERLFSTLTGDIVCRFIHEGDLYDFHSKVRKVIGEGLTLIDYPTHLEHRRLRKYPRIRVNIETKLTLDRDSECLIATMTDISESGCLLAISSLHTIAHQAACHLDFNLPDSSTIRGIKAIIKNVKILKLKQTTEVGIHFLGPNEELAKVASFCRFCLFFDV